MLTEQDEGRKLVEEGEMEIYGVLQRLKNEALRLERGKKIMKCPLQMPITSSRQSMSPLVLLQIRWVMEN